MQKTIMVDLDDIIISFSEMFVRECNKYVRRMYNITDKELKIEDIQEYEFKKGFLNVFNELSEDDYECIEEIILNDDVLYCMPIYTEESMIVFNLVKHYKDMGYKIILHTKVSTVRMINSKTTLFRQDNRFNLFDEIILDWERGIHSPKPTHYDVIIDDSPYNIQHYLNNNPYGKVYTTLRPWNKQFKNEERVFVIGE